MAAQTTTTPIPTQAFGDLNVQIAGLVARHEQALSEEFVSQIATLKQERDELLEKCHTLYQELESKDEQIHYLEEQLTANRTTSVSSDSETTSLTHTTQLGTNSHEFNRVFEFIKTNDARPFEKKTKDGRVHLFPNINSEPEYDESGSRILKYRYFSGDDSGESFERTFRNRTGQPGWGQNIRHPLIKEITGRKLSIIQIIRDPEYYDMFA